MKKLLIATAILCIAVCSDAQDYSAVIYRNSATPQAIQASSIDSIRVEETSKVDASYYSKDTVYVVPSQESKWKGKKVAFLGDSMTANGEYVVDYQDLTGCEALNYGVSATHLAKIDASTTNAFEDRYTEITRTASLVVVFGGTNDFGHVNTAEFGEFTDGAQAGKYTFYAGLHRLFKGLRTRFKTKPIVFVTPVHHGIKIDNPEYTIADDGSITEGTNPTTGKTFKEYVNAIKEVAAYYSIPVLDAYSQSSLSPMLEQTTNEYFKDGLHFSDKGAKRFAKWLYPLLEQVYDQWY